MERFKLLLEKEMTRKEFLGYFGVFFLSFIGMSTLLGILTKPDEIKNASGFGGGFFGR